jgi:hypothetical protein
MAKKFLDTLADAFDDEVLGEVIPQQRKSRGSTRRGKKSFLESIGQSLDEPPQEKPTRAKAKSKPRRKSFLDTLEEALDSHAFDDVIPIEQPRWKRKTQPDTEDFSAAELESRFSTMITTEVLNRAREIAIAKGIRVKEVINIALSRYVEEESERL